jgi:hypothetical protein
MQKRTDRTTVGVLLDFPPQGSRGLPLSLTLATKIRKSRLAKGQLRTLRNNMQTKQTRAPRSSCDSLSAFPIIARDRHLFTMRQRITLLHKPGDAIDPKSITVTEDSLSLSGLKASREDRITFGVEELPPEISLALKQAHELHIRYVNRISYESISPLLSRVAPGLHVYYTPQRNSSNSYCAPWYILENSANVYSDLLCPLVNKIFNPSLKYLCQSPEVGSPLSLHRKKYSNT